MHMNAIHCYESPLGRIVMESDGERLTALRFEDGEQAPETGNLPVFRETDRWLDEYFSGRDPGFTPPLLPQGTPFRRAVWEILLAIPYGRTMTYGKIAEEMAARMNVPKMSAQAVGGAVGHNPVSLIIPCHRVVGSDGSMTGYAYGTGRKIRLLELEHADLFSKR